MTTQQLAEHRALSWKIQHHKACLVRVSSNLFNYLGKVQADLLLVNEKLTGGYPPCYTPGEVSVSYYRYTTDVREQMVQVKIDDSGAEPLALIALIKRQGAYNSHIPKQTLQLPFSIPFLRDLMTLSMRPAAVPALNEYEFQMLLNANSEAAVQLLVSKYPTLQAAQSSQPQAQPVSQSGYCLEV